VLKLEKNGYFDAVMADVPPCTHKQ